MKPLYNLLGLLILLVTPLGAQQSVSNYVGFEVERVRANTITLIGINSSNQLGREQSRTISDLFGFYNDARLTPTGDGTATNADVVWVQVEDRWEQVFYNFYDREFPPMTTGWRAVGRGNEDMSGLVVERGFMIDSKQNEDWGLVIAGHVNPGVKTYKTNQNLSIVNRGTPVPITFNESNIHQSMGLLKGDQNTADIIWIQNEGVWEGYYYAVTKTFPPLSEGWKKIGAGDQDYGYQLITSSAFILQAKGPSDRQLRILPPSNFDSTQKITVKGAPPRTIIDWDLRIGFGQNANLLYFVTSWPAVKGLHYDTQYYNEFGSWQTFASRDFVGVNGAETFSDYAVLGTGLYWGVARVISEYINW